MKCVIISKKNLDNFGKKLMKEVYEYLHDDYFLTFDEVKSERKKWNKNLVIKFKDFYEDRQFKFDCLYFNLISYEDLNNMSDKDLLKKIEDQIKNKNIDLEIIFYILDNLKFDPDLNEDIYYNHKAFISSFNTYHYYHSYLED